MREAALQKRRKAAEELLRWHRKLLDEERKIGELEAAATSVVRQTPETQKDKYKFTGSQLNRLWRAMTGSDEKKFVEDKHYVMSLERLCKSARQYSNRNKKTSTKNIQQTNESGDAEKFAKKTSADDVNYSSGFEPESVQEMINSQEEKTKISSISELIDNFSKIEDEISTLSRNSESIVNLKEDSDRSSQALQNRFEEIQSEIEESKAVPNESEVSSSKDIEDEELSVVEIIEEPKEETADSSIKLSPKEETEGSSIKLSLKEETGGSSIKLSPKEETEDSSIKLSLKEGTEDSSVKLSPEEEAEDSSIKLSPKDISAPEQYTEQTEKTVEDEITKSTQEIPTQTAAEESEQQKSVSTVLEDEDKTKSVLVSTTLEDEDKTKSVIQDQVVTTEAVEASEQRESQEVSTFVEDEKTSTLDEDLEEVSSQKDILVESKSSIPFEEENSSQKSPQVSFKTQELAKEDTSLQSEEPEPESEEKSSVESKYDELSKSIEASENTTNKKSSKKSQIEQETDTQKTSTTITTQEKIEDIQESTTESLSKDVGKDLEEALESASKIEESLSKLNEKLSNEKTVSKDKSEEVSTDKNEEISTEKEAESIGEMQSSSKEESSNSVNTETDEKTPQKKINQIDVKKRVSEILADASPSRGDKSPRLQDLYITAYDVGAANSPEHNESNEDGRQLPTDIFGSEAEELWRKQLAIEQEIKQIELQQKEQLPYVFMREIPNKPPPPYTPPSSLLSLPQSILPTDVKEINEIASYSSKVLFKAYQNNNLDKVKFSENGFKLFSKIDVSKICAEYVFNICRDIATDYYRQFEVVEGPSWLVVTKKPQLAKIKLPDATGLERILSQKLKELFGFKKAQVAESAIIKWGRKKRDHVDEVLVIESQEEESQWTNFDKDELIVKNQVTDEIMKMLLEETANVFEKILSKKKSAAG